MVECPICGKPVRQTNINSHIDSGCTTDVELELPASQVPSSKSPAVFTYFKPSEGRKPAPNGSSQPSALDTPPSTLKRSFHDANESPNDVQKEKDMVVTNGADSETPAKRAKPTALLRAAPLAERMRPKTLDEVYGQELVGPNGVLRGLIESDRVPSMILWGGTGTGKTTIARVIANMVGSRFIEINSTSSGVAECKKIFGEAKAELGLTGRKTIVFCDEIHRFNKGQQDVFLGPVEAGIVTLIGATTENPSFKVQNALLSRCRTFTLSKLTDRDIVDILKHALETEARPSSSSSLRFLDDDLLNYLATFSDGDARTALNLLELALELSTRPNITKSRIKQSLTQTLVYDRAGDQHYDTISALHKSIRGSDPDAALYYLARMLQSGEDALYIARRLIVVASEDVGLADNSMLSLATATYSACEKIGMPECRINLAHCVVSLSLSHKSTRVYRALANATDALAEPGVAGLPIPYHIRNAPTRLMKEMGYGKDYKYNPDYVDGRVKQEYLPDRLRGRRFLEDRDLGTRVDSDLEDGDEDGDDELQEGEDTRHTQEEILLDEPFNA